MNESAVVIELRRSIRSKDIAAVRRICEGDPSLITDHMPGDPDSKQRKAWTCFAAQEGGCNVVGALIELGFNIDAANLPETNSAITIAIYRNDVEMLEFLLRLGANPNVGRPVVAAMNRDDARLRLPMVQLLVENGLDVNKEYDLYGDATKSFTALDWARDPDIQAYLRSQGAEYKAELADPKQVAPQRTATISAASSGDSTPAKAGPDIEPPQAAVVRYFAANFGPVDDRSLVEIVPSGQPIAVHVIRPEGDRKHLTLFTAGLSARPMQVPSAEEQFAYAELFVQLPGDWKADAIGDATWSWPIHWLRKIAEYPHNHRTWLGGPLTIVANDDPPKPLAPNTRMTSLLLLAEKSFLRADGKTVQLYRVTPIYSEERELELREGGAALMRALDRHGVPYIVDVHRPSVVPSSSSG